MFETLLVGSAFVPNRSRTKPILSCGILLGDMYPRSRAGNKSTEGSRDPASIQRGLELANLATKPSPISAPIQRRRFAIRIAFVAANSEEGKQEGDEGRDNKRTAPAATESAAEAKLAALREQIAQKNREIENKRSDLANYEILNAESRGSKRGVENR